MVKKKKTIHRRERLDVETACVDSRPPFRSGKVPRQRLPNRTRTIAPAIRHFGQTMRSAIEILVLDI